MNGMEKDIVQWQRNRQATTQPRNRPSNQVVTRPPRHDELPNDYPSRSCDGNVCDDQHETEKHYKTRSTWASKETELAVQLHSRKESELKQARCCDVNSAHSESSRHRFATEVISLPPAGVRAILRVQGGMKLVDMESGSGVPEDSSFEGTLAENGRSDAAISSSSRSFKAEALKA